MALAGRVTGSRALGALVLFELRRRWHGHRLWIAILLVGLAVFLLGIFVRTHLMYFSDAKDIYHSVYVVTLALVFRFEVAHDMDLGFADFMSPNFVRVSTYLQARMAAGLAALVQFALVAFVLTALAPGFSLRFAAWSTAFWLLLGLFFAPFVALSELWLRTRLPVIVVALFAMILMFLGLTGGFYDGLVRALGASQAVTGSFASLGALAWRAALVGFGGLALVQPVTRRHWGPERG